MGSGLAVFLGRDTFSFCTISSPDGAIATARFLDPSTAPGSIIWSVLFFPASPAGFLPPPSPPPEEDFILRDPSPPPPARSSTKQATKHLQAVHSSLIRLFIPEGSDYNAEGLVLSLKVRLGGRAFRV